MIRGRGGERWMDSAAQTTHCVQASPLRVAYAQQLKTTGGLSRESWHVCADFRGKMMHLSYVCNSWAGSGSVLSRRECFTLEHRAFGQKRILPEGWLYNSQKFILIEFFTLCAGM